MKLFCAFIFLKLGGVFGLPMRSVRLTGLRKYINYWHSLCKYGGFLLLLQTLSCSIAVGKKLATEGACTSAVGEIKYWTVYDPKNLNDFSEKPLRRIIRIKPAYKVIFEFHSRTNAQHFCIKRNSTVERVIFSPWIFFLSSYLNLKSSELLCSCLSQAITTVLQKECLIFGFLQGFSYEWNCVESYYLQTTVQFLSSLFPKLMPDCQMKTSQLYVRFC